VRVTGVPSSDRRVVDSCLTLTTSRSRARVLIGRSRIITLMGFFRLREGAEEKVVGLEVQLHCLKVHHVFRYHTSSGSGVTELEGLLGYTFKLLSQLNEVRCSS
jgi:hypothetical protein